MRPDASYSEATRIVAAEAEREPAWVGYASYCRLRERGLRAEAFEHLTRFLDAASGWSFEGRRAFVGWLCNHLERPSWERLDFVPYPLGSRLLAPTLAEWITREPSSPLPHRWTGILLGGYSWVSVRAGLSRSSRDALSHLRRAIELDPAEQPARVRLAELLIGGLDFDAHHLPDYYIGDPAADVREAEEAAALIEDIADAEVRGRLRAELAASRALLDDWLAFQGEGATDFGEWCRVRGRPYRWRRHYYYGNDDAAG